MGYSFTGAGKHGGVSIMRFTLTYDGELGSDRGPAQKWSIRKQISPQLEELWRISPALQDVQRRRWIPESDPYSLFEVHHMADDKRAFTQAPGKGSIDLCAPIVKGGRQFWPLVRNSLALRCGLKITFMRKEEPGKVYQGGDLDNRIKTLFDALSVPNVDQVVEDDGIGDPIHCLIEDDALISGITIETHRLLASPSMSPHTVHLLIEVDVRVVRPRVYNCLFLGD